MDGLQLELLGVVGNALVVMGYFPQIRKIIVTKKAEDISILTWIGYLTGDLCLLTYAILTNDGVFVSLFTLFTVGNVTLILLTLRYGKVHLPRFKKNPAANPARQDHDTKPPNP